MGINTRREQKEKDTLAQHQGITFDAALEKMKEDATHASEEVEDYIVSVACEEAEGMYMFHGDKLEWMIPAKGENQHIEIVVQDRKDKRFLPGLEITCHVKDDTDTVVAQFATPFVWHPFLFHYGMNCVIPKKGKYTIDVVISKPTFHRHDEEVGLRYKKDVVVSLGPVQLTPGRKEHGPE